MKKILAILLSLVLVLGLAACGDEPVETTAPPSRPLLWPAAKPPLPRKSIPWPS